LGLLGKGIWKLRKEPRRERTEKEKQGQVEGGASLRQAVHCQKAFLSNRMIFTESVSARGLRQPAYRDGNGDVSLQCLHEDVSSRRKVAQQSTQKKRIKNDLAQAVFS